MNTFTNFFVYLAWFCLIFGIIALTAAIYCTITYTKLDEIKDLRFKGGITVYYIWRWIIVICVSSTALLVYYL